MPKVTISKRGEVAISFGMRAVGTGNSDPSDWNTTDAAETGQLRNTGPRKIRGPSVVDLEAGTSTPIDHY